MNSEQLHYSPSCCYYPTTILMVDDNKDLLADLSFGLMSGAPQYKSHYSTNPHEIMDILTRQGNTIESFIKNHVSVTEEDMDLAKAIVNIDIPSIHHVIYKKSPLRFNEYIVLIVDYAMPDMNGLELCKKIRRELHLPIKIIMLTGEADQTTAIKAFNDKLIDRFLVKGSEDYMQKLMTYIHELHEEYFNEMSNLIIESSRAHQPALLQKEPAFVELFNQIINQYQAVEFYLLEEPGSFLFLDARKNAIRLIVKTEEDMQTSYEIAADERDTPKEKLDALKNRKKLVFFRDQKSHLQPAKQWLLLEATPLKAQKTYYYAIAKGTEHAPLETKNLVSYYEFLNGQ